MFGGGGSQFVFNLGGGPGFRVHQFGGNRPRRRPREATDGADERQQSSATSVITNLLPLLILFILPLLSSLFSGDSTPSGPTFRFESAQPPHTMHRMTPNYKVNYYVNPRDVDDYSRSKWHQLDKKVEVNYVQKLRYECDAEIQSRNRMVQEAQGWFFQDVDKMNAARQLKMTSCRRLDELRVPY